MKSWLFFFRQWNNKYFYPILLILLCFFCLSIYFFSQNQSFIVVKGGKVQCVWQESTFILKWRHSVEKQFWQEVYQQDGNQLRLTQTFMQTFGAGVPATGENIPAPKGYVGLASNVMLPKLHWVVSRNMQGQMIGKDKILSIYERVPDYTEIEIKVENYPKIIWLFKEKCQ